ncbi:hypothetical protein TcWFU_009848 [Taenia crassiceps]|uniref:PITH domain-containing protein n=1 Tax=Taenia crassiceps TaxID=6207 RepID=A0ABR4QAE8_9CEST
MQGIGTELSSRFRLPQISPSGKSKTLATLVPLAIVTRLVIDRAFSTNQRMTTSPRQRQQLALDLHSKSSMMRSLVYAVAVASCILVCFKQSHGRLIVSEDLQCDCRRCKIRAAIDDYVRIERGLELDIRGSNPPHDPFCHPNYDLCHNYSGSTFLKISGDFNKKDVTHLVLSKGQMDATLLIHRMNGGQYHKRERRILHTTPPVLTIEESYKILQPVQITVPYFSDSLPKCVAYFGSAKVEDVFSADEGGDSEPGGVQVEWTGSQSSVKIHGKVVKVPFKIIFLGENGGEEFTFVFLSSSLQKCSLLLTFITLLGTVAYSQ